MLEYIYFVKCDGCEDEHFDFFNDAKDFAMSCISKKPIITQIEVNRNDFGECVDSCDLGTVWSWEDIMQASDDEPVQTVFSKDDLCDCGGTCGGDCKCGKHADSEFDALDIAFDSKYDDFVVEHVNDRPTPVESDQELFGIDNAIVDCDVAKVITHSEDEKPLACKGKAVPANMSIKDLVEAMEENEDTIECACCQELFPKEDCFYDEERGWLCGDCEDSAVKCTWCDELYDRSECRKEVDLGWLCGHCEAAIKSRGEKLTFVEGSYWDLLDESAVSEAAKPETVDLEYDNLTVLVQGPKRDVDDWDEIYVDTDYTLTKDKADVAYEIWENFMTDEDVASVEGGFDTLEDDAEFDKFMKANFDTLFDKYYDKLLALYEDEAYEKCESEMSWDDVMSRREKPWSLDEALEADKEHMSTCPECGKESYNMKEQYCSTCGMGL
jgi:hypothetical protein